MDDTRPQRKNLGEKSYTLTSKSLQFIGKGRIGVPVCRPDTGQSFGPDYGVGVKDSLPDTSFRILYLV